MANEALENIGPSGNIIRFPVARLSWKACGGGNMTIDTTFKEFVEEKGVNFCLLGFGSRKYRKLVEAFNRFKFKLEAEEEAREWERIRVRLMLGERPATEDLFGHRTRQRRARIVAAPQP